MLLKGVMPMPPASNTAGLAVFLCSVNDPIGPSILTPSPSGTVLSTRLNAVSRMRVAMVICSSKGALAIENVRIFPSASVSGGSSNVKSSDCPGVNWNPCGFSK